jgi:hypothetical protein
MRIHLGISGCLALALMTGCVACGAEAFPEKSVKLKLSCQKVEYVLDEPIWATLTITNETESMVEFTIGNGSDDSYTFAVSNATTGSFVMLDPYFPFGGLTQRQRLRPGEMFVREILLTEYIWFKKPSNYNVQCKIKFSILSKGHGVIINPPPSMEIAINRDENSLIKILREISESAKNSNPQARTRAVRSLVSVRNSLVLPFLIEPLEDNDAAVVEQALQGISRIGGPEAMKILSQYAKKHEGTRLGKFSAGLMNRNQR